MHRTKEIELAIGAHGLWKSRLRTAIKTGSSDISVSVAQDDRQCAFGKWLHGTGLDPEMKRSDAYRKCIELHRQFHIAAAGVLSLSLAGRKKEAALALDPTSEFSRISGELTRTLMAWDTARCSELVRK